MLLTPPRIRQLLRDVHQKRLTPRQAYTRLARLPYDCVDGAHLDTHRALRKRYPEAVFCEGKRLNQLLTIVPQLARSVDPLLLTRLDRDRFDRLQRVVPRLRYHELARMATLHRRQPRPRRVRGALILTAGTADLPVADEARVTVEAFGHRAQVISDVGVAGIHRLLEHVETIQQAPVVIVVAGMEGALASCVGGLAAAPVIAVPTSVGYGASFKGLSALLTMLNACAPGVVTVNIDNGFGAGYFASILLARNYR